MNNEIKKALYTLELSHLSGQLSNEEIEKARTTKYYKREGSPGKYKYYYTKEQYDREKGKGGESGEGKYKATIQDESRLKKIKPQLDILVELRERGGRLDEDGEQRLNDLLKEYEEITGESFDKKEERGDKHTVSYINAMGKPDKVEVRIRNATEGEAVEWVKKHTKGSDFKVEKEEGDDKLSDKKEEKQTDKKTGDVHEHDGKKYKKQSSGKWLEVSESHNFTKKEHDMASQFYTNKGSEEQKEHQEAASKLSGKEHSDEEVGLKKEEEGSLTEKQKQNLAKFSREERAELLAAYVEGAKTEKQINKFQEIRNYFKELDSQKQPTGKKEGGISKYPKESLPKKKDGSIDWKKTKEEIWSDYVNVPSQYRKPELAEKIYNELKENYVEKQFKEFKEKKGNLFNQELNRAIEEKDSQKIANLSKTLSDEELDETIEEFYELASYNSFYIPVVNILGKVKEKRETVKQKSVEKLGEEIEEVKNKLESEESQSKSESKLQRDIKWLENQIKSKPNMAAKFQSKLIEKKKELKRSKSVTKSDYLNELSNLLPNDINKAEGITKSDVYYALDSGMGTDQIKFKKKGSEIKDKIRPKYEDYLTRHSGLKTALEEVKQEVVDTGVEIKAMDEYGYPVFNHTNNYTNPTETDKKIREYDSLLYKCEDINKDIKAMRVLLENLEDGKSYELSARQLMVFEK